MSKTEHPANMVLLTESERFVQIFALLVDNNGQYESNRTVGKVDLSIVNTENHVYLNSSTFLALQTDWWVRVRAIRQPNANFNASMLS